MCDIGELRYGEGYTEGVEDGIEKGIRVLILVLWAAGVSEEIIIEQLHQQYDLSTDRAKQYLAEY